MDQTEGERGHEIEEGQGRAHWCFVRPADVESDPAWEPIKALLDKHCESFRAEDVRAAVRAGQFQLWLARSGSELLAVMVTQLVRRRDHLACVVADIGGTEMLQWIEDRGLLRRWASDNGCSAIEGYGRDGWLRFLPDAERTGIAWRVRL